MGIVNSNGEQTLSAGNVKLNAAAGNAVISRVVALTQPQSSVAVKVTVYVVSVPSESNVAVVFGVKAEVPFPKSQANSSACVLMLLNATLNGAQPLSMEAVKSACGCGLM